MKYIRDYLKERFIFTSKVVGVVITGKIISHGDYQFCTILNCEVQSGQFNDCVVMHSNIRNGTFEDSVVRENKVHNININRCDDRHNEILK